MKIITEDTIRRLLRTKELCDGADFVLEQASLITPSAQSYLREHHITVHKAKEPAKSGASRVTSEYLPVTERERFPSKEVELESQHLSNLLYFPDLADSAFSGEWWLYFEQQQRWLADFGANRAELVQVPSACPMIALADRRRWLFTCGEIQYQIEKILNLMTAAEMSAAKQHFSRWSQELLKVIRSTKNE